MQRRRLLGRLFREEQGATLVTAVGALVALTTFAAAAALTAVRISNESVRDRSVKRGVAAADAAVARATYEMNMVQPTSANPCVTGTSLLVRGSAGGGGWCTARTVDMGGGATADYTVSPWVEANGEVTRTIVASATVNSVTRRVAATVSTRTGTPLFGNYGMESDENFTISGNGRVDGSVRSNHAINMSGNAVICGNATPGPGSQVSRSGNARVCEGYSTQPAYSTFSLPPVDQGDAPTNNDNGRFFTQDTKTGNVSWNAGTRQLSMSSNQTLNLSGHTYSFCKFSMSGNSHLTIAVGAVVRIFIDSPENCGLPDNTTQLSWSGNAQVSNLNNDPTYFQIYMLGSTSLTTRASMTGNATATDMTLYAPNSLLNMSGNGASYGGAMVAKQITVSGNGATVTYDSRVTELNEDTTGVYRRSRYVECTPGPVSAQNTDC